MIQQTINNVGADSNLDIVVLAIWGAIFLFLAYKFVQAIFPSHCLIYGNGGCVTMLLF